MLLGGLVVIDGHTCPDGTRDDVHDPLLVLCAAAMSPRWLLVVFKILAALVIGLTMPLLCRDYPKFNAFVVIRKRRLMSGKLQTTEKTFLSVQHVRRLAA